MNIYTLFTELYTHVSAHAKNQVFISSIRVTIKKTHQVDIYKVEII